MTRYLSLAEFWFLAEQVTGIGSTTLLRAAHPRTERRKRVFFEETTRLVGAWSSPAEVIR